MNNKLQISIITPVLNGERYIEQTIQSVIRQDYDDIEYLIVDGGSTDGTLDIIKKYENEIDFWISEPDDGIYDAQNKGINVAKGEYFAVLNSGDYYADKNVISKVVSRLVAEENLDYVYSNAFLIKETKNRHIVNFYSNVANIWKFSPIPHPALFSKVCLFREFGGFDVSYRVAADYDYICKLFANKTRGIKIDEFTVFIRQGGYSYLNMETPREVFLIQKKYCSSHIRCFINYYSRILHLYSLKCLLKIVGEKNFNRIKSVRYFKN
jgi:glycosyltransferase involved in cell wall biosynthesis